jgi:hypothetical protein
MRSERTARCSTEQRFVADVPDALTLKRNRDLEGRRDVLVRRIGVAILLVLLALALLNLFGQRPGTTTAETEAAKLSVYAPSRVRSGLIYEARITVDAVRELKRAALVFDTGWTEGLTINTIEPGPIGEASRDGHLALELGHVPAGQRYVLYLQLQVNPTNVGHRSQDVQLLDGDAVVTTVERSITVFP